MISWGAFKKKLPVIDVEVQVMKEIEKLHKTWTKKFKEARQEMDQVESDVNGKTQPKTFGISLFRSLLFQF